MDVVWEFNSALRIACEENPDFTPHKDELLRFAKEHERYPLVIANLQNELKKYERAFRHRDLGARILDRARIITTVAQLFLKAIKEKRDQDNWSSAHKVAEANKNQLHNEVSEVLKEVPRRGSTPEGS